MLPARDHVDAVDLQENSNLTDLSLVCGPQASKICTDDKCRAMAEQVRAFLSTCAGPFCPHQILFGGRSNLSQSTLS